jgi:hypothetical protein
MAAATGAGAPAEEQRAQGRWLWGAAPDLLVGCGLLYALGFLALAWVGPSVRAAQPGALAPLLILVLSAPHYGATLLRVYERSRDRRAYALFSLWATLCVLLWFAAGFVQPWVGSLLVTLFLTWSPWHYTGQNYGIAVMFLRRAGADLDPITKRWLYASFLLSFGLTAVVMHGQATAPGYDVATAPAAAGAVRFLSLGIPATATNFLVPALVLAWLAALGVSALRLRSRTDLRSLLPVAALALTQTLWFTVPLLLRHAQAAPFEALDFDFRTYYFLWIALGHAAQYLWVTSYYARVGSDGRGLGRWYVKTLLAGEAMFVVPIVLLGPLGVLSHDGGLALLVSAAVNVHHFILDGAIWKLRSSRVANVLIRNVPEAPGTTEPGRSGLRGAVWGVSLACLAITAFVSWSEHVTLRRRILAGDLAGATQVLDRLGWFGYDHGTYRTAIATDLLAAGDTENASKQAQRALEIEPNLRAWLVLGDAEARQGHWRAAAEAYEGALRIEPASVPLLMRSAQAALRSGERGRAEGFVREAHRLAPENPAVKEAVAGLGVDLSQDGR